jgi:hypothetical protein
MNTSLQNQNQGQQNKKLSMEELQKTQVLNLQDFEEVARFEKMTSKKPAIIVAIIGLLCITFGTTYQIADNLSSKKPESTVSKRVVDTTYEDKTNETSLVCSLIDNARTDGTDTSLKITYTFTDDALTSFTKDFVVSPTTGNALGPATVQSYVTGYQPYMVTNVPGYTINVTNDGTSVFAKVTVDYTTIDMTTFPEYQQTHYTTSIDYASGTSLEAIKADMISKNYTCE